MFIALTRATPAKFPLIVFSHGTGQRGGDLAWLGTALSPRSTPPGKNAALAAIILWCERARDLSAAIDGLIADPTFMSPIGAQRIGAAGFSLGV